MIGIEFLFEPMDNRDNIVDQLNRIEKLAYKPRSTWFTIKEAAMHIKLSERTLRRWLATGTLKTYRLPAGGHRILRRDLDGLIMYGKQYSKLVSQQKRAVNELT